MQGFMKQAIYIKDVEHPVTVEVVSIISEHRKARGVRRGCKRVMGVIRAKGGKLRTHHFEVER